jgi:hypothetical protein
MPEAFSTSNQFLPWLRRGIGRFVGPELDGSSPLRSLLRVTVQLQQTTEGAVPPETARSAEVSLPMFGPEDVVGLDSGVVARMWPRPDADDAESVFFPLVEFSEPDLPWRYSLAGTLERVTPWLVLIVLREDEFTFLPSGSEQRLATVTVNPNVPLPDLAQAWAWAHVDAEGSDSVASVQLPGGTAPGRRIVARLLAARRLQPRARYAAFVVPVYGRACDALLGNPLRPSAAFSWTLTTSQTTGESRTILPVYHHWRFGTGEEGSFESLGRRLEPGTAAEVAPEAIPGRTLTPGTRRIGIGPLPVGMRASAVDVELGGALRPIAAGNPLEVSIGAVSAADWSLTRLLTETASVTTQPIVGPPFYGRWHAPTRTIGNAWVREVNLDLGYRIVAGAGAEIVQEQQQDLMAGAWTQLEGIRRINEELRFSQLSREASTRLYCRDFCSIPIDTLLALTGPVQAQVRCGSETIATTLAGSRLIPGSLDPQWRRLARPRGPLARRQGRVGRSLTPYGQMNDGTLRAAGPPPAPLALSTAGSVLLGLRPDGPGQSSNLPKGEEKTPTLCPELPLAAQLILFLVGALLASPDASFDPVGSWRQLCQDAKEGRCGDLLPRLIELLGRMELPTDYRPFVPMPSTDGEDGTLGGPVDPRSILTLFTQSFDASARQRPARAKARPEVDLGHLAGCLREALNPRRSIARAVTSRLRGVGGGVRQNPDDPLEPVMACPVFPQPMFKPLYDRSPAWLMPGLERLPNNRVLPTEMNKSFVEAYMVGLNHEMARELFWSEYPTDQRGTAFAQFWPTTGAARNVRDITPIHEWGTTALGTHRPASPGFAGTPLVFIVRGDLLRRYPNVTFFMVRQQGGAFSPNIDPPTFIGQLPPDTTFVGFDLSLGDVEDQAQGWRLVIQEPAGETRFRLPDGAGAAELPAYRPAGSTGRAGPDPSVYLFTEAPTGASNASSYFLVPGASGGLASSARVALALLHPMTWIVFDATSLIQSAGGAS